MPLILQELTLCLDERKGCTVAKKGFDTRRPDRYHHFFAGIHADDIAAKAGNLERKCAVAAAEIQHSLTGLRREQARTGLPSSTTKPAFARYFFGSEP